MKNPAATINMVKGSFGVLNIVIKISIPITTNMKSHFFINVCFFMIYLPSFMKYATYLFTSPYVIK